MGTVDTDAVVNGDYAEEEEITWNEDGVWMGESATLCSYVTEKSRLKMWWWSWLLLLLEVLMLLADITPLLNQPSCGGWSETGDEVPQTR